MTHDAPRPGAAGPFADPHDLVDVMMTARRIQAKAVADLVAIAWAWLARRVHGAAPTASGAPGGRRPQPVH